MSAKGDYATVLLKSMLPTVNMDSCIGLDVHVKVERHKTLTVARGLLPLDWVQEIRLSQSSQFSVLAEARKAVIGRAPGGDWYGIHTMDRFGSLK